MVLPCDRDYADSVISSHRLHDLEDTEIPVPHEAEFYIIEGHNTEIITFYRWKSRSDLTEVPEKWKGSTVRFLAVKQRRY